MTAAFIIFYVVVNVLDNKNINRIKSKTVGDGQHGTARWATKPEIRRTFSSSPFAPEDWRQGKNLPSVQGTVVACRGGKHTTALVDTGDVHTLMIGAAGVGKTAYFLYPNIEFACASGMSFLSTDTKGDIARNYGRIARDCYGYNVSVIDLRNPTRSDENNILHLVNKYMDIYLNDRTNLSAKAKAEKYAKITAKTIINIGGGNSANYGQNAFFYDAAEGLLGSVILLLAEFGEKNERHIVSVFKLIQDLIAKPPAKTAKDKPKMYFTTLMEKLPSEHKAKWLAGAALNSADQSMMSVMSTALSRLNSFLDSEMEQILCFGTAIDAEVFCRERSAIFIILPEEDQSKYFMVSLLIQQLYREILTIADENGGTLTDRVMFYCDEFGTFPKIEGAEAMFSAGRSRKISIVAIIQSFAQLEQKYGKEGMEIITDNTQLTVFGGFAPNSQSAEVLSKALGEQTVQSGSVSLGKERSQSIQMMGRPLMTVDELKSMPKGQFIVMKTGTHPMISKLKLYFKWGIRFGEPFLLEDRGARRVDYAERDRLISAVEQKYPQKTPMRSEPADNGFIPMDTDFASKTKANVRTE
ncbi:type IV secretory system conjugative DNA transfer family protein [Ruminococcus sp.]|uniref:type IV secretory system conjugative DNA transfer family protein n=1 Tax=Ruminococcus sp. TaxID=41978 RepID=UPI0025ED2AB1|nr:type IV secretory system conjugative DNA transfer family protein [Ruminococcus sp.]